MLLDLRRLVSGLPQPQAVTEKYGAPDILVNNAGITKD